MQMRDLFEDNFVLNRSEFEEPIVKNNLYKQSLGANRPTNRPKLHTIICQNWQITTWQKQDQLRKVMQSRVQLLSRLSNWLLGEAEDNREQLRKGLKLQTNKVAN